MAKTVNNVKINTTFATAASREQLTSGENLCTSLGKINKYLADLDTGAFSFPANGGNADTAKQINCVDIIGTADSCTYHTILDWANHYTYQGCSAWAFIRSDYGYPDDAPEQAEAVVRIESDESGARRLVTWAIYGGNVSYVRSIFNSAWHTSEWKRTNDGGNADTLDGKHASDLAYLTDIIGGLKLGYASVNAGTIMTYGDRDVVKTTNDLSYFGWTINTDGWFVPIVVSQYPSGTNYTMFGNNFGYGISQDSEYASFAYKGRTYYACWSNGGAYLNPAVVGGLHLTLTNNDYISACKTLIDACEAIDSDTLAGMHAWTHAVLNSSGYFDGKAYFLCKENATGDGRYALSASDGKEIATNHAYVSGSVISPNEKVRLWEDSEGGNLRLVSPDGNHSVEMDLHNNEGFRMYFTDNGELTFPVDYNFTTKKFNINGNAATLETHPASDFLYANGFAGQLAKLFSQPANDNELATLFSVVPDDATLNDLNPGVYVVNTSAARKSIGVPDEIQLGGPSTSISEDTMLRPGGILIKFGSVLGNPGYSTFISAAGALTPSPFMKSCAFFISNNGSLYTARTLIFARTQHNDQGQVTGYIGETKWAWKALVFEDYNNYNQFTIHDIKYLSSEEVIPPNSYYLMYVTKAMYNLPYKSGKAYGPTQAYSLVSYRDGLCIRNSGSENLILPAGQYLIHAT